jgi:hypothetical protein
MRIYEVEGMVEMCLYSREKKNIWTVQMSSNRFKKDEILARRIGGPIADFRAFRIFDWLIL